MATNYIRPFGLSLEQGCETVDIVVDTTNDSEFAANNAGAGGNAAGDTISVGPLPAGIVFSTAICRTDKAYTGNIDLGVTGSLTSLFSSGTPAAGVGGCIASSSALTAVSASSTSTNYLILNLKSANTTGGALKIKVGVASVMVPYVGITQ